MTLAALQNKKNVIPQPSTTPAPFLQRRCACGGIPGPTGECAECRRKRLGLQREATNQAAGHPASVERFSHDFGRVRVHPDTRMWGLAGTVGTGNGMGGFDRSLSGARAAENGSFGGMTASSSSEDPHITADIKVVHHAPKAAMLSETGEAVEAEADGEGVTKLAQEEVAGAAVGAAAGAAVGAFAGAAVGAVAGAAARAAGAAAAGCTYSITYANMTKPGCSGGRCGAQIVYDITKVTATGSGCPPKLEGLKLTESVTTDQGCIPGGVTTGPGCTIGPGGTLTGCTDTYALCAPAASYPAAGCTEVYTQKLFVGGVHAETRTITFRITKSGGACSGTVTRT